MINKIKEMFRPKTIEEIEEQIIGKQKEAEELQLKLQALKAKKEIDADITKLKRQIRDLS